MKRRFCTILMVALLVLPAASLGVAQESPPPAPEGWGALHDLRPPARLPEGDAAVPWFPPERSGPGAVITVTTTDDELNGDGDCSLREAIQAANTDAAVDACTAGSGADTVLVPAGTYLLTIPGAGEDGNQTGDLDILDNLTLTGDGAEVTILDGNSLDRLLQIHTGRTVEINALTVTGGLVINWNGSAIFNRGTLTLNHATVRENTVQSTLGHGGALANEALVQDATAYVNHSLIAENTSSGSGLQNTCGSNLTAELHVDHSTVMSNTTQFSGGIYSGYYDGATDCTSILTVTDSVVAGNTTDYFGGGIFAIGSEADNVVSTLTVDHSTIHNNTTVATGDIAGLGGGLLAYDTETTIVDSTIHDNEAFCDGFSLCGAGGGLFLMEGTATVERTTIRNNTATHTGSGGGGGGLALLDGVATLRNSTVSGNQASHGGGGIHVNGWTMNAILTLENTTVANNDAGLAGGGIVNQNNGFGATTSFKNSLVAGNSAPSDGSCSNPDLGFGPGILDSLGHNLEDYDYCEFDQPSDLPVTDPILGPLQDNGGPTWTHALLAGSPAIDAGDDAAAPPTDQRGVPRPQGPASDIGAFELEVNILVNTCDDELNDDGDCSLREALEAANTNTPVDACGAGDLLTDTIAFVVAGTITVTSQLSVIAGGPLVVDGGQVITVSGGGAGRLWYVQSGSELSLQRLVVMGGFVADGGGGLYNDQSAKVTLIDSILSGNRSMFGGAIYNAGTMTVTDSTLSGNSAGSVIVGYGGAIYNVGTMAVTNSTLSGNSAGGGDGGWGGAIGNGGTMAVTNSTLSGNTADWGGGIWGWPMTITNTIVANSLDGGDCGGDAVIDGGHNLDSDGTCGLDPANGSLPNTDPVLGPLQDNGGPTWTHALLQGSPAIDAGDDSACPPTDQRGVPRPQGPHCDIGSFEADTVPPAVMAVSPPDGATGVALDATLVLTFSEPISVPTFAYSVAPDPGGWTESWGPNDTVVSLTHDLFAPGTIYTASVTAAEDRAGNPLASPYAWSFSTVACDPVEAVTVEGPASLLLGETGVYSATYAPITATLPVTLTWQDGTVGATAVYSWTLPGTYTLAVTATNPCSEVSGTFSVAVCQPVEAVTVEGPAVLQVGETGVYMAARAPLTATLPVTLTWQDGTVGATAAYSWTLPGTYTLTVTATNPCGEAVGSFPVEVSIYRIYLPLVVRDSG